MKIVWHTIPDFPEYEINRLGEIRRKSTGRVLKPFDDRRGYLRVSLNGCNVKVHLLVAKMFVPNPHGYCFIYTFGLELGMAMTFQPKKGAGAGCTYSMGYYKKAGRFFKDPQPGDQIFFTNDGGASSYHTGLVEKVEGGRVYTIEGNTSSAPGVVPNGGAVRDKSYSLGYNQIAGYGRPDWSLAGEETEEMTQDQFNDMFKVAMAAYRAELQDNDCGSYSAEGRQFMIDKGLMVGGNPLPNGEPNYMWQDFLTREQFATVLFRYAKALGIA